MSAADHGSTESHVDLSKLEKLGEFWYPENLHPKQYNRLVDMSDYYTAERIHTLLLPIITQQDALSLRVLDWLVTNYAKKNNVVYEYEVEPGERLMLNVYSEYKSWLRNYRRRNFDPFRRRTRLYFVHQGVQHETTVGQLNFIYWADTFGVLAYTRKNLQTIEKDMNRSLSQVRRLKEEEGARGVKRKRRELSAAPRNKCFVYDVAVKVAFVDSDEEGHEEHEPETKTSSPSQVDAGDEGVPAPLVVQV